MSSSSPPVDYQKPVKVKSRWTQSCQIEMMIEESQSSLDMSDNITDVSTSDLNESTDYSSEFNSIELRKSHRTKDTNYRRSNKKKTTIASENSNKRGLRKNQSSNTSDIDLEDKFKCNILQDSNIIIRRHLSVDLDNITIFQSNSDNNMSEIIDKLPSKRIRRASVPWKFKYTFTKDVKDNITLLENDNYFNFSNAINYLNLNEMQLSEDKKLAQKENTASKNTRQQLYCLNFRDFDGLNNEILHITELNEISARHFSKLKVSDELNMDDNNDKTYQNSNLSIPKPFLSELDSLKCSPICKPREIRSKSCDSIMKKSDNLFKRYKSLNNINQIENVEIYDLKPQKPEIKSPKKKRRQSKRIKPKNNYIDDLKVPEINYNQIADEIYKEHKKQLYEARINDKEFDEKLLATNFTLVDENVYRPNR